jgi:prenyl protein peptidase
VVTVYVLAILGNASPHEVLRQLGVWPVNPFDTMKVLGLVMVLFACSLYEWIIVDSVWQTWTVSTFKETVFDSWIGYRNLIVAPVSEEVVFRSLTIPLFLLAKVNPTRIVFVTPLVFGLAHLHHLIEFLQARTTAGQRSPSVQVLIQGTLRSVFQFTYTSLFGFFAAFVFLRTGNIWAAIIAHSFCNHLGVPRLWGKVGQFADYDYIPVELKPKRADDPDTTVQVGNSLMDNEDEPVIKSVEMLPPDGPKSLGVAWTVVYYALVLAGMYGFYKLLFPLTESPLALASF